MTNKFSGLVDSNGNPVKLIAGDCFNVRKTDNLVRFGIGNSRMEYCGGNVTYAQGLKMTTDKDSGQFGHAGINKLSSKWLTLLLTDILAIAGIYCQLISDEESYIKYEIVQDDSPFRGLVDSKDNPIKLIAGDCFSVRKDDNLVTFSIDTIKRRSCGGNMTYARGLKTTAGKDSKQFDVASVHRLDTKRWCMLLVDILAIAGVRVKELPETLGLIRYEVVSVGYADSIILA